MNNKKTDGMTYHVAALQYAMYAHCTLNYAISKNVCIECIYLSETGEPVSLMCEYKYICLYFCASLLFDSTPATYICMYIYSVFMCPHSQIYTHERVQFKMKPVFHGCVVQTWLEELRLRRTAIAATLGWMQQCCFGC